MKQNKPKLLIDWCSHDAAKYACENWHYSKCIPKSKLVKLGVWENEVFIGVIIFGVGATNTLVKRFGLDSNQGCELVRVALRSHVNTVTKMISIALKMLKKANPGIRLVVSFADPEQGHVGGIYQGGNWRFCGKSQSSDEYIYKGKRWQGRSFRNSFKGMEKHPSVKTVKGSSKYRYVMPMDRDMNKIIERFLIRKYPKRVEHESNAVDFQSTEGGAVPTDALHIE